MMMNGLVSEIALAALIGAMQQAIQHWFPWRLVFKAELPRVIAYIIGTLAYLVPLSVVYLHWDQSDQAVPRYAHLIALWVCVTASGLAVLVVRFVDWLLDRIRSANESQQREQVAMDALKGSIDAKE